MKSISKAYILFISLLGVMMVSSDLIALQSVDHLILSKIKQVSFTDGSTQKKAEKMSLASKPAIELVSQSSEAFEEPNATTRVGAFNMRFKDRNNHGIKEIRVPAVSLRTLISSKRVHAARFPVRVQPADGGSVRDAAGYMKVVAEGKRAAHGLIVVQDGDSLIQTEFRMKQSM